MQRPLLLPDGWEPRLRVALTDLDTGWTGERLVPLGAGMDFWVFGLGDRLTVRCPQHDEAADLATTQRHVLPVIADHLTLAVPRPLRTGSNPLGPGEFDVFTRVPGESSDDDTWHRHGWLADARNVAIVARTLDELAAVPVAEARQAGVAPRRLRDSLARRAGRARAELAALLPVAAATALLERFERFVADGANFPAAEVVIHADVSLDHLLVTDGVITGLIDFGDVAIGDPDCELAYLYADAGREFVAAVQARRGRPLSAAVEHKLQFFELADHVADALWALDHADPVLLASAIDHLARHSSEG